MPMWIGHIDHRNKSDRTMASNHHMAFVIDFIEFLSETLKALANPSLLILCYMGAGLMHLNTLQKFNGC